MVYANTGSNSKELTVKQKDGWISLERLVRKALKNDGSVDSEISPKFIKETNSRSFRNRRKRKTFREKKFKKELEDLSAQYKKDI